MTRRSILKLSVGAIVALVVATPAEPVMARTLQEILSSKKIRLGTIPYPPMTQLEFEDRQVFRPVDRRA